MENNFLPDTDVMYSALLKRDAAFEGIFYAGVKTTGVFCRPTCRARKPLKTNIEYFGSAAEALNQGYRACKICEPMLVNSASPPWIEALLKEIHDSPTQNIKDYHLRQRELDPVKVRRWFLKHHHITFHAYQRSVRLNHAFGRLQKGEKISDTAYDSGYESLSGFSQAYKKAMGFSPGDSIEKKLITISRINTPLGPMIAAAVEEGICLLEFTDRRMLETQIKRLKKYLHAQFVPGVNQHIKSLKLQLHEYFDGKRADFNIALVYPGTDFQQKIWTQLLEIPAGSTRSYTEQASVYGNLKVIRAVAKANGDNRIAILIPCHRVVGSDGAMTGYGGGIWRKKWLLHHEMVLAQKLRKG